MPFFKDSFLETIRSRVNIYDIASGYVSLKKSGAAFKGLSPFTSEKTPSFFVYPDKNFFYCFSTAQGGDIFKFVMIKESMNFADAVEFIAHRFGIEVEYEENSKFKKQNSSLTKQIFEINEDAAAYFAENFWAETNEAQILRKYWQEERSFSVEDAKIMRIGFATLDDSRLKKILENKGYTIEAIKACGLFFAREQDKFLNNLRSRFRGRLMIPICDRFGRTVAFTARKTQFTPTDIAYEEGKYINSPETEVFKKNALLFNLDKARESISEKDTAILVEGQIDAMRMFSCGFQNTVASQGTSLGIEQLGLIKKYAGNLIILYDGDSPGAKASLGAIEVAIQAGLFPTVIRLPNGDDPDTYLKNNGKASMQKLLDDFRQKPMFYYVAEVRKKSPNLSTSQKSALLEKMFEIICNSVSTIAEDDYLRTLALALLVEPTPLIRDYASWKKRRFSQKNRDDFTPKKTQTQSVGILTNAAYDALLVCLNHDSLAEMLSKVIQEDWLNPDDKYEALLLRVLALYKEGIGFDISDIDSHFENESEQKIIYEILSKDDNNIENPVNVANKCAQTLFRKYCLAQIQTLNAELADPQKTFEEKSRILEKIKALRNQSKNPLPQIS